MFVGIAVALSILFLRAQGLAYGWNTFEYVFVGQMRAIPRLVAQGVALQLAVQLLRKQGRRYLREIASLRWLASTAVVWIAAIGILYAYLWLKVSVPLVRTVLYDAELWRLDRWLHFGVAPSIFAIELAAGTPLAPLLDRWYALWMPTIPLAFSYVFSSADERLRRNFLLGNALLWIGGAWLYLLLPAVGPCYATPEILEPIRSEIPRAVASQAGLWANYGRMLGGRSGALPWFQPEFGVAAMPSLHVAAHAFFAFWCRRHERRLFVLWALATGLTFLGSLVTGWHYAVDGYVGILLAWAAYRIAERLSPAPPAEATAPPPPVAR